MAAYVRFLVRANAPDTVINDFKEIVEIDNGIAEEGRDIESLDRLLLDVCRRYGFARAFDKPAARAWLRPSTIEDNHPDCYEDTGWGLGDKNFNPVAEQAYRRGYDQGFDEAKRLIEGGNVRSLPARQAELYKWRRAPIYYGASFPGFVENWGIKVSIRSSLPARLRFDVLERDKRKCVICGSSAGDGIVLHVDHITAVSRCGSNAIDNLQTLCEECNLGKGAR